MNEATTFKIQQPVADKPGRPKEQNDWMQGYCYQFWRCQHDGFRGDGAFGQFTIVLPKQDAVIVMTSETNNMQGELDLVWQHLLPAFKPKALPPGPSHAPIHVAHAAPKPNGPAKKGGIDLDLTPDADDGEFEKF